MTDAAGTDVQPAPQASDQSLDQELELGLMSVAAPVYNGPGKVVAAVNVSLQAQSVAAGQDPDAYLASVAEEIVATANVISADLGARQ